MDLQKNLTINKTSINTFIAIVIYRILLDIIYVDIIVPIFGYSGYTIRPNLAIYIISWFILLLFAPSIIRNNNNQKYPSCLVILIISLVTFIPFTTLIGYGLFSIEYIVCNIIYWIFLFVFHRLFLNIQIIRLKALNRSFANSLIIIIGIALSAVSLFISWKYTGFRFNFNLFNVYELRRETISFNLPLIIEYIFSASKAISPLLLVYSFNKKKYFISSIILLIQFLSFGINGMKSVFFITLLVVLVFLFYKDKYMYKTIYFTAILAFSGLLEFYICKTFFIVNLLIRRMMFLTNLLNYYYFDFFTNNTPDYFRQSILRYIGIKSPYPEIRHMIGRIYFSKPEMGANSGLISDAITNFGIIGLILMPFIVIIGLRIFDNCVEGLDKRFYLALCVLVAYYFISSFFLTIYITHGFLALCIVFYILPRDKN